MGQKKMEESKKKKIDGNAAHLLKQLKITKPTSYMERQALQRHLTAGTTNATGTASPLDESSTSTIPLEESIKKKQQAVSEQGKEAKPAETDNTEVVTTSITDPHRESSSGKKPVMETPKTDEEKKTKADEDDDSKKNVDGPVEKIP